MKTAFLLLGLLIGLQAFADQETKLETKAGAPPIETASAWKATANSTYYDLEGTRPANGDTYSFGDVRLSSENMELDYSANAWKYLVRAKYLKNDWDVLAGGGSYAETTQGLGDTLVGAAHPVYMGPVFKLIADGGFYLPTGSINEANAYIPGQHYKYFMQLGSGTVDETVGLTSLAAAWPTQLGTRLSTILRNGHNGNGYQLGNVFRADAWADVPMNFGLTPRVVGYYRLTRPMEGADPLIYRAATEFYYHDQVDWMVAAALKYERPLTRSLVFNAEAGVPFAQGMQNSDNVVLMINYYGNFSINGQF